MSIIKKDHEPIKIGDIFFSGLFWFFVLIMWFLVRMCIEFVTETAAEGRFLTNPVKVIDEDTDDEYYLSLIVDSFTEPGYDDYSEYAAYSVYGYVSPETGKVIETESDFERIGTTCYFSRRISRDNYQEFSVVVKYSDIQVSFFRKIKDHPIYFLISFGLTGLFICYLVSLLIKIIKYNNSLKDKPFE